LKNEGWATCIETLLAYIQEKNLDYRIVAYAFSRRKSTGGTLCVKMFDDYLVVVLPLTVPFFMHICDNDRVTYLSATQISASKDVFDSLCYFRPTLRTKYLAAFFAMGQAAQFYGQRWYCVTKVCED
jgi:hypothetical protein